MPKYKNIKSVAHNLGYSFLSDLNYVGTGSQFCYVPELLYETAKSTRSPLIRIDFMARTVEPRSVAIPQVLKAVEHYANWLPKLLESQSVVPAMVRAARMTLTFDFAHPRPSKYDVDKELPNLTCVVSMEDDRGVIHEASPNKWYVE